MVALPWFHHTLYSPVQGTKLNLPLYQQKKVCLFSFLCHKALERKAGYLAYWKQSKSRMSPEANTIMVPFWLAVEAESNI